MLKWIKLAKENGDARRCITYVLAVIGLIFVASSILLIVVGATAKPTYDDFRQFLNKTFTSIPIVLICLGVIMLIVGGDGIIRVFKVTNTNLTYTCYMFLVVFVLNISMAISGFVLQNRVRETLIGTMNRSIAAYPYSQSGEGAIDFMQRSLECCGIDGPYDWFEVFDPIVSDNVTIKVPDSCCAGFAESPCNEYFLKGCLNQMQSIIGRVIVISAIGAAVVVSLQILIVLSGFWYLKIVLSRNMVAATTSTG